METDFHGAWRAPRNVFDMNEGLQNILNNWDTYRNNVIQTGQNLSWFNRTNELIKLYYEYERSFN